MNDHHISTKFTVFDNQSELSPIENELLNKAIQARDSAYAPYSSFNVGAAVILDNDQIFLGNNQENAAYPSGLCAERVAIFYAGAQYPGVPVVSIAIAAFTEGEFQAEPVPPCGACRQVLYEKETEGGAPMEVILYGRNRIQVLRSAADLLPIPFILNKAE